MHRSRGTLPGRGGRPPRGSASAKGRASSGLTAAKKKGRESSGTPASAKGRASSQLTASPSTPEALRLLETFRAGVRQSPRFAVAAATPADDGDNEDCGGESQPLLSPPACVPTTYVCNWAQAIQCMYSTLKPLPCQREGCDFLVHHLCQGAWERQKGYEDTVARLCCLHHPDYKYEGAPSKVSVAVKNAQDVMSKAKVVNVESQVTAPSISFAHEDDSGESSSDANGSDVSVDDPDDPAWGDPIFDGGRVGGGVDDIVGTSEEHEELPPLMTDYTADTYDIHERTAHFMERRPISASNRVAVEAVYMVEALTTVKSMKTMRKPEIAQRLQDKYKAFINAIPLERFSDRSLKVSMEAKYLRAKGGSATGLLTKANDVLKNVRIIAAGIRGIGTPLHQIPSGRSLMDMRNEFILKNWNALQGTVYAPSNNDDELMLDVEDGWWLTNNNTNLLLSVLVHRCNPDVIADPTTVRTGTTRENLRKDSQKDLVERRERDRILEHHATGRQRAEESMLQSKAQLMAQTIDSGTIDQVKEQLTLLSQFKDSFVKVQNRIDGKGEDDYDQTAHDLLSELPFLKKRRILDADNNSEVDNINDSQTRKSNN